MPRHVRRCDRVFSGRPVSALTRGELLARVIQTQEQAEQWIRDLVAIDLAFHFDDSPETIIDIRTDQRTFTDEEAVLIRARISEIYEHDYEAGCPIGFLLDVTQGTGWRTE